jgi:hypothetical protein
MLARRSFLRGAGLVAAGALAPMTALAPVKALAAAGAPDDLRVAERDKLVPPPKNFASNHNYWIYAGGAPIRGLTVTMEVTEDVAAPTGLNLQLNGNSPADANCVYQQYCMGIDPRHKTRLGWSNENFPSAKWRWALHNRHGLPCGKNPHPDEQTCRGDIFNMHGVVGFFPRMINRLPAGSKLVWKLIDDADGTIVGASYTFVNPEGKRTSTGPQLIKAFRLEGGRADVDPQSCAPVLAVQMNIVGLNGGAYTELRTGAGRIIYEAAVALTPEGQQPAATSARGVSTAETSNIRYAELTAAPGRKIVQKFRAA